jgi:DNA polymerase III delta subunit
MIYLFYGNDEIRSRDKFDAIINSLSAKSPEASLSRLTSENFKIENLEELTKSQGLFYQKFIVACDNLLSGDKGNKEILDLVSVNLKEIAESANVFIFLENGADTKALLEIEKLAVKSQKFEKRVGELSRHGSFNIFSITDAFTAKNKNRAWLLFQEALMSGVSAEEVLWKLIWSVNNLLLVKNTKDISKLKMKPYPLTKAKNAAKTFSNEELKRLSASLVDLYHLNYLGTDEFEFGLEKIILSI